MVIVIWSIVICCPGDSSHSLFQEKIAFSFNHLTNSATATAYVTGHDWSLTSKMTGWGAVMTGPDRSHTSKMTGWGRFVTGWGAVCDWLGGSL